MNKKLVNDVMWTAQDEDGEWWVYANKPITHIDVERKGYWYDIDDDQCLSGMVGIGKKSKDWQQSLMKVKVKRNGEERCILKKL